MDALLYLRSALLDLWSRWTISQRVVLIVGTLLCIAAVLGVGVWAARPEFVRLAEHLSPAETAETVAALEAAGIQYQLNFAGSVVLVPQSALSAARLAAKDIIIAEPADESDWGDDLWADPARQHARLLREQEQRLAHSIRQMRPVRDATVHLSQPQPSPFVRERFPAKASVVLDLRPGFTLTSADAHSLVTLVAHSVEGLTAEQVSIVDTDGRQLSGAQAVDADIAGRLEYQQRLEAALAAKAEAVLAQVLGVGRSVVRVTAELDFKETTRVETTFDPDGKVKLSEEIETETNSQPKAVVGGPPGTASNLGSVAGKAGDSQLLSKRETNKTQYDNARIEDRVTEAPGRITRLTIAAVIHPPETQEGQAAPQLDQPAIEKLVQQAVGFDPARQDQIAVLLAPPGSAPALTPWPSEEPWTQYERLLRAASLGLGAIAALVIGGLLLRRIRPVMVTAPEPAGVTVDAAHRLAELSQIVRDQPDVAARVLRAWLGPESAASAPPPAVRRAAS